MAEKSAVNRLVVGSSPTPGVVALCRCDHLDVSTSEGVGHTVVISRHTCKLGSQAERACNVDGVERADVDRLHISRGGYDVVAQLDDGSRGDDALKDQASVSGRLGALLASPCHSAWKLDFGDDARGEVGPLQEFRLDRG